AAGAGGWCGASGFDDAELPAGHLGPEVAGRRPLRLGAGLVVLQKIVTCRYVSSGLRRGLRIGVRRGHDAVCPGSGVAARLVRVRFAARFASGSRAVLARFSRGSRALLADLRLRVTAALAGLAGLLLAGPISGPAGLHLRPRRVVGREVGDHPAVLDRLPQADLDQLAGRRPGPDAKLGAQIG